MQGDNVPTVQSTRAMYSMVLSPSTSREPFKKKQIGIATCDTFAPLNQPSLNKNLPDFSIRIRIISLPLLSSFLHPFFLPHGAESIR